MFFGLRTCKVHRELKWGDIIKDVTSSGVEYLIYDKERQTKTRTGEDPSNTRAFNPKAFSSDLPSTLRRDVVQSISAIDPVVIYKLYASKRPISMSGEETPFYLAQNVLRNSDRDKPWHIDGPLGVNKLNSLMKTMASKAGLRGRLTNHSGRKTMMQELVNNNVPPNQIIQLSGHSNLKSVNNYSKLSGKQQQDMSRIISNFTNVTQPENSTALVRPSSSSLVAQSNEALEHSSFALLGRQNAMQLHSTNSFQQNTVDVDETRKANVAMFSGATITGGEITININGPASKKRRTNNIIFSDTDESQSQ